MNADECLPPALRGPTTTLTPLVRGLSGAAVYRVEAAGAQYVLKIAGASERDADWHHALQMQRLAAEAGLAPRVLHVDEARRAVLTPFIVDRSFVGYLRNPGTHEAALAQLGRTVRRLHEVPLPANASGRQPLEFLAQTWEQLAGFALPAFVRDGIQRALAEPAPAEEGPPVFSHNDLNPGNLVYDGESILFLDWATAGPQDGSYDLAVLAVFLRLDDATCLRLLSAYDGAPCTALPAGFVYHRRLAATLAGAVALLLARQAKHAGATGAETLASTPALGEFYQRMMKGELKLGTPEGQWWFGLALLKHGLSV
ncbi:phosphotransferase [Aggregicoccus sp. 17bor-14]|uniref:phosphotransferase n=1 Tax=Myxococcaceae TaxID=31 RepID=UPI00129C55E2|nr:MULTISPECIES: phosphotransferase [Myxococcaceae]MBF5043806.1 phosphotransferase [Simulacricoccus sp. 17bor-14]MRI89559.1 phosphotransferase [Aggregicoccus sp. 17bor-14]